MLRWSVLALSLLVDAPVVWSSFVSQTTTVEAALVRLLITIPIVAALLGFVRLAGQSDRAASTPSDRSEANVVRDE